VTIRYNVLNLPDVIQFRNGNQVINSYDAAGKKLRTRYYTTMINVNVPVGTIHGDYSTSEASLRLDDYFGNILYENGTSESNHPLTKVLTPEGYIDYSNGNRYCYYLKDHLGSIREVTSYQGNIGTKIQDTQYYPSGTPFEQSHGVGEQPYKFTGKEFITMHGLNWQDYGARWLDNVRMQWTTMDSHAEKFYYESPYVYAGNNPINAFDPDGKLKVYLGDINDETSYAFFKSLPDDPNVLIAVVHGYPGGCTVFKNDENINEGKGFTVETGDSFIKAVGWAIHDKNRFEGDPNYKNLRNVQLLICDGALEGNMGTSLAQEISKVNNGLWVSAAMANIIISSDGKYSGPYSITLKYGNNCSGYDLLFWKLFYNGKLMNYMSYNSKTKKFTDVSKEEYEKQQHQRLRNFYSLLNNNIPQNPSNSGKYNRTSIQRLYDDDFLQVYNGWGEKK
jgi:RHS repeat-associated protein